MNNFKHRDSFSSCQRKAASRLSESWSKNKVTLTEESRISCHLSGSFAASRRRVPGTSSVACNMLKTAAVVLIGSVYRFARHVR